MDEKRGIGRNNDLLFRLDADFKRMKDLTRGHPIVMGRKTFESIGRVLPERTSIVVTRDSEKVKSVSFYKPEVKIVGSLDEGLEKAEESPGADEVFIFGGGEIFKQAIEEGVVDRLYLTQVAGDFGADTFFPDYSQFREVVHEESGHEGEYDFKFVDLEK